MSQRRINIIITLLISLLFFVLFYDQTVMINGPAVSSIEFRPFSGGINTKKIYGEGVYMIWPWNKVYQFNTREQMVEETLHIIVENGVTVTMLINYRYKPVVDSLPVIFRQYGVHYDDVFVKPEVIANTRDIISGYAPEYIYTVQIDSIRNLIYNRTRDSLAPGNVVLTDFAILNIELPEKVVNAIENKLSEQQLSIQYDYKIDIAGKQQTIKIIEARAIEAAQNIINPGLTPEYLQYKQIEAMQNLSLSPNTKTIVMPAGRNTPLILNGQ